jgi:hypothetical protein
MRITSIERLEDCFDGSRVFRYEFDEPWTRPAILLLAALGALDYFPDFPRPFYRLRGAGGLQMKGVEGMRHCRLIVSPGHHDRFRLELERRLAAE